MRRKRTAMREKRTYRVAIRLNHWERDLIERAIHIQGMKTGYFVSFASFVRGHALCKANSLIQQWQKRPKAERAKLVQEYEADYGKLEDDQEVA